MLLVLVELKHRSGVNLESSTSRFRTSLQLALCALIAFSLGWVVASAKRIDQPESVGSAVSSNQMLRALANYGYARSGRMQNTFFIPATANLGSNYVVFWKEENLLFSFPAGKISPDAVTRPSLVVESVWTLDSKSFRLPGDHEAKTSTYLESWDWALQRVFDAVGKGKMYVLNHKP